MNPTPHFSHIVGVDFSGGIEAGRKVWLTTCTLDDAGRLVVQSVVRADQLPGSGLGRDLVYPAVVRALAALPRPLVGLDFPLAIPAKLQPEQGWSSWSRGLAGHFADADAFRDDLVARSQGREHKRATEVVAKTPFASYNLRLYQQTYFGVTGLLVPLLESGRFRALPFEDIDAERGVLIEACPASYLKFADRYLSYKGQSTSQLTARHKIYEHLIDAGLIAEPDEDPHRATLVADEQGDALDSLLCAVCCLRALRGAALDAHPSETDRAEGHVYY